MNEIIRKRKDSKSTGKSKSLTMEEYKEQLKIFHDTTGRFDEHFKEVEITTTPLSFTFDTIKEAKSFKILLTIKVKTKRCRDSYSSQRKNSVLVLPKDIASGEIGTIID